MLSKLWHNVVMTSAVEFYCLPCESYLRSSSDAELHIAKPVHKKALDATPFAEGQEDDRIRKVPSGFYCEFCNILFTASSKVRLHVSDPTHVTTKGTQLLKREGTSIIAFNNVALKREGTSIIAFNNVAISEKAWNGFQGNTCLVCSKDFVFENIHKSDKEHIIKLVQRKVEFGYDKSIYRMTEDGYQCLTCNEELLQAKFDDHFSSTEHKNKYKECIISIENRIDENHDKNGTNDQENSKTAGDKTKEVNENVKAQEVKESVKAQEVKETIKPKKVKEANVKQEVKKPKADTKDAVNNSKNTSKDDTESEDPYKVDKRFCDVLNADEYVCELDNRFCLLCEVEVESKTAHVASTHHQKMLVLHKNRLAKKKASNANVNESDENNPDVNGSNGEHTTEAKSPTSEPEDKNKSNKDTYVDNDNNNSRDKILDSINELSKDGINVNFETSVASCKSCKEVLEFDYDVIKDHIADHKDKKSPSGKFDLTELKEESKNTTLFSTPVTMKKTEAAENVEVKEEMKEFAKKNGLEVQDNFYVCNVCGVHLTDPNVKTHVYGKAHNNRMRKQKKATPERALVVFAQKVPMMDFIKDISQIKNLAFTDFVINFKYCINALSFFMYTKQGNRLRCQVCRVNMSLPEVDIHKMEHEHTEKMKTTPVLTSFEDEFIREVQPKVLHCGSCNIVVDEKDIQNHLASAQHKEIKRAMQARLHNYVPLIRQRRRQEAAQETMFIHMLTRAIMMQNEF